MSTWRKKKGQKFFSPPSNRIRQRRGKGKKALQKSHSWYPERPDTASFSSAADLIAQVRYEALIEARAKTIAKRHWGNIFKQKQKEEHNLAVAHHYGVDPNIRRYMIDTPDELKKTGFLEPLNELGELPTEAEMKKLADEDAAVGSIDRFDRKIRLEHLSHSFYESRMLKKKLTELQIEWDEKVKNRKEQRQREYPKTKKKPNRFSPSSSTTGLKKIESFLARHNHKELSGKLHRERMEAVKARERRKKRKRNKLGNQCYLTEPPDLLFEEDKKAYTPNAMAKHYPTRRTCHASEIAAQRATRDLKIVLPPVPDAHKSQWKQLDGGGVEAIISGGKRIRTNYRWR
jgi:hypothetical protein